MEPLLEPDRGGGGVPGGAVVGGGAPGEGEDGRGGCIVGTGNGGKEGAVAVSFQK